MTQNPRPARSAHVRIAALLAAGLGGGHAAACELDGLSHGYGPMSAIFAGAHRYQALNGLAEEEAPPAEVAGVDAPANDPAAATPSGNVPTANRTAPVSAPAAPPTPRRSFAAWARAAPKPAGAVAETPAGAVAETPAPWAGADRPLRNSAEAAAPRAPVASASPKP